MIHVTMNKNNQLRQVDSLSNLPSEAKLVVDEYVPELSRIFGNHLEKIILYGSSARGENREDSDIDVAVVSNLPKQYIRWNSTYWKQAIDAAFAINERHDFHVLLSPKIVDAAFLKEWSPLQHNIMSEGIVIWKKAS